jgi:hypothetical protein
MAATATKIAGIIVPANWDSEGNITGVAIQSYDESEYVIESNDLDRILNQFIHKPVVVTGNIKEHLDSKKFIWVLSIKAISNNDIHHYVDTAHRFHPPIRWKTDI